MSSAITAFKTSLMRLVVASVWPTLLLACGMMSVNAQGVSSPEIASTNAAPTTIVLFQEAFQFRNQGDWDDALTRVNAVLQHDPNNLGGHILRGDLYAKKRMWPQANDDFTAALKIKADNRVARFDLAEIKLMQRQYAEAKLAFLSLKDDSELGDLVAYKIFLCDLYGKNEDEASKEFVSFEHAGRGASYYYAHAAWNLYYKRPEDAQSWLDSAARIYTPNKNHNYLSTLEEFGYLPLSSK